MDQATGRGGGRGGGLYFLRYFVKRGKHALIVEICRWPERCLSGIASSSEEHTAVMAVRAWKAWKAGRKLIWGSKEIRGVGRDAPSRMTDMMMM